MWSILKNEVNPSIMPYFSGSAFIDPIIGATFGTLVVTVDVLYAVPMFIEKRRLCTSITFEVTALAVGNGRAGIYNDSDGVPGSLVVDGGEISVATTGAKSATISQILTPGWYWLATLFGTLAPTVRAVRQVGTVFFLGWSSNTDITEHPGVSVAQAYGALPNPFTAGSTLISSNIPRVVLGF